MRRRRSAHVTLLLAWVAFWLNTALLPCCEVFAAAFDAHADGVSQSAPVAKRAHHADTMHTERARGSNESRCDFTLNAQPLINGEYAGLPKAGRDLELVALSVPLSVGPVAVNHSPSLAPRNYHPPPPLAANRLYLHTQRLLI